MVCCGSVVVDVPAPLEVIGELVVPVSFEGRDELFCELVVAASPDDFDVVVCFFLVVCLLVAG